MQQLKLTGTIFYGLGIAGIGVLQFIYPGFRPVILPVPPEATQHVNFLVYLTAAILVFAGLYIVVARKRKTASLGLGLLLLLFVLAGHLPNRLANHPDILGAWTDALKLLALSGGAFMISALYPDNTNGTSDVAGRMAACGKYFFALMLVTFGIDHFVYTDFVKALVPRWIPGELFWTYVGGVGLIGSGLAIALNFKPKIISLLLAIMLLVWLVTLHIPRAVSAPGNDNGNEWTSVFQCLAFSGMALLYKYVPGSNRTRASSAPSYSGI
jgi:uncharacterized membrane protein YphA (DoxX/SURF4 family)